MRGGGLIPIGALTLLALASPSLAQAQQQVTASVSPNVAGAQSSVAVDVSPGAQVSSSAATPQSVVLDSPQGLLYDGRSRSTRCSTQQAQSFSCPDSSRVGSGQAQFTISGPFLPPQGQQLTFLLAAFLAPPQQPGDVAGVVMQATQQGGSQRRSIIGRLLHGGNAPYDLELRVDVGNVQAPPGYTARFDRLQLTIGATRTIKKVRHKRRHHRLIRIVRKIRYSLLTNPAVCTSAGWPYRLVVQYADHADTSGGSLGCGPPSG